MADRVRHDSKQRVKEGEKHDCSTTTEAALTEELSEDLRDAWESLRVTAVSFGDQRIYASHIDHVRAQILLLLRAPEEELSGTLRVAWPCAESPSGAPGRSPIEGQAGSPLSPQAPGRDRGARNCLASRGVRII